MEDLDHFNLKTVEYVNNVNKIFLDEYKIDGFRFDAGRYIGWDLNQTEFGLNAWTDALYNYDNDVIQIIQPTHFIAISARPEEIYNRRMKDETRNRDKVSIESIKKELAIQDSMLSTCSVLSGSPMKVILNNEGKIEEAANNVIKAIGV